jgi:NAD-dependent dihydropyrimidine dehydrogenase PreA subunit
MIGGAILHVVLHWRWVVTMTRRAFGKPRSSTRKAASPAGRGAQPAPGHAAVVAPLAATAVQAGADGGSASASLRSPVSGDASRPASGTAGIYVPGERASGASFMAGGDDDPRAAVSGSGVDANATTTLRSTAAADGPGPHDGSRRRMAAETCGGSGDRQPGDRRKGDRRISRKAFLAGTAAACGGAALVLILGRGDDSTAISTGEAVAGDSGDSGGGNGWGNGDGSGSLDESGSEGLDDGSEDLESSGSTSPDADAVEPQPTPEAAPDSSTERVSIDSSCNGCGDCVNACPYGVFSFDGTRAVVVAPDACVLCGRCVRVCPTQAITLRA